MTPRYLTGRASRDDGRWHGDYGPHHALTWAQAQQSLLRQLDLPTTRQLPVVNPDVYLHADDGDGDYLTCPSCHEPITMLADGDRLGSLIAEVTAHRCGPATTA
ncbi:hypothetical protein Aca07nite_84400 [Actinoplanes capillaceus]|uniref:Uncharacterized protein n=1 Tax=Actinoplanes campanulatus TaxID=113559 RepID=A0ABQ3WYF4_9ACTN|nr:hypothetical protein [Actinoplanes capillaceus]GID51165.1 hypothetical protein Aca07nite_84400 [Actinoplanes capillaceus]